MADSPWDIMSAIGTVGAVGVALWFSIKSVMANGKAERDRAQLAAARMLSPLSTLDRKAAYIGLCIGFRNLDEDGLGANVLKALEELDELSKTISIDDLYPLLQLPRHAAKRSARALGLIQTLVSDAHSMLTHPYWLRMNNFEKGLHFDRWTKMLSEINDHFSVSVAECALAASTGAPRPSKQEIHGQFSGR